MQILILKPSSLGDIICALPVAQSIRDQNPDAVISWVVKSRFRDIVERCPTVNGEIIEFRHQSGPRGLLELWRTIRTVRARHFDAVLDFQGLLRTGLMAAASHSPLKLCNGDAREGSRLASHQVVPFPTGGKNTNAIERLLQFLPAIGLEPSLRSPIRIQGDSLDSVDPRLAGTRPVVMIPNSRGQERQWPGFPELTVQLLQNSSEATVVWDSHIAWDDPPTEHKDRFFNLTTCTSLMQMVELLQNARLVIANDSGPLHIAAALGIPTLGLYGPTLPERTGPYPLTEPRNHVLRSPTRKIGDIPVETVLSSVLSIIESEPQIQAA